MWVEKNGDLLFYLSKTDAWSGNGRLLKIGKIRLSLSPNPFTEDKPFVQKLILADGLIHIEAGEKNNSISIDIWVDANNQVVEMDVNSEKPINAKITTEPWRTNRRQIVNDNELHSAYGLGGANAPEVFIEKDTILTDAKEGVVWLHRNEKSIWLDNLKLQSLDGYVEKNTDPLLHRTFGGLIRSTELEKTAPATLSNREPLKRFSVSVYALTSQTKTQKDWVNQITENAFAIESKSRNERLNAHKNWWHSFWNRSFINISTQNNSEKEKVFITARAYALQRACALQQL